MEQHKEFGLLPAEFTSPLPEITAHQDEFNRNLQEEESSVKPKKKKHLLYLAAIVLTICGVFTFGPKVSMPPAEAEETNNMTLPVSEIQASDPVVTISKATIMRAASSNYSVVDFKYSLDNNGADYPLYLFYEVESETGDKTPLPPSPSKKTEDLIDEKDFIETTSLDSTKKMTLHIYVGMDDEDGVRWIVYSKDVEEEYFPMVELNIDFAKYIPQTSYMPAHVEYGATIKCSDDIYPVKLSGYVEDETGYNRNDSHNPYEIESDEPFSSGLVFTEGLTGELTLNCSITFNWDDDEITMFEHIPVDMSLYEEPAETYQLADGIIVLTVYNNSFDFDMVDDPVFPWMKILYHGEIKESEWEDFVLPEPEDNNEDWDPVGFVIHYNGEFDYGYDSAIDKSFIRRIDGNVLTKENIEAIPPTESGYRYVNVHVLWYPYRNYDFKLRLELALNDGTDDVEVWEADQPFASEGYTYLCVFDEPERDGYTFKGWYDEAGNQVEWLSYYDFFDPIEGATSKEDRDWEHPHAVRLYAKWEKIC